MGTAYQPHCSNCNTTFRTLYLGGGMVDRGRICNVPVPCYDCGKLMQLNLLRKNLRCSSCSKVVKPFGEIVSGEIEEAENVAFSWNLDAVYEKRYELKDEKVKCVKCKENTLNLFGGGEFAIHIMWD